MLAFQLVKAAGRPMLHPGPWACQHSLRGDASQARTLFILFGLFGDAEASHPTPRRRAESLLGLLPQPEHAETRRVGRSRLRCKYLGSPLIPL